MLTRIPAAALPMQAAAYDTADEEMAVLRDGSAVLIRPLATGDVKAITTWFEGLGPAARRDRFLASVGRLNDSMLWQLAQVDHHEHEALTAVTADGATVGIARYIRLPDTGTAELAVAVADLWRGRGIASLLLQGIATRARAAGICWLTVECLASNTAIVSLLSRLGPVSIAPPAWEVMQVRIDLERAGRSAG